MYSYTYVCMCIHTSTPRLIRRAQVLTLHTSTTHLPVVYVYRQWASVACCQR